MLSSGKMADAIVPRIVPAGTIVLGIDGGGTRTRAVIAQGEHVLARATGGSIKQLRVGYEAANASLRELLQEVLSAAGAASQTGNGSAIRVAAACAGVASASMPGVREWITQTLTEFGIPLSEVVGDEIIALDAAFHGGPGILQIAGTGSHCIGRAPGGALERVGGYSFVLGDEGSGYWIGLEGVRRALRAHDGDCDRNDDQDDDRENGSELSPILSRVANAWGAASLRELIQMGNATPAPDFAALAPLIAEAGELGNAVAIGVLSDAAAHLAESIGIASRRLRQRHGFSEEIPVAWTGSVLEKMGIVRTRMLEILKQNVPGLRIAQASVLPVEGALWRANRLACSNSHSG